jgi:AcrR family transcriptional regulator
MPVRPERVPAEEVRQRMLDAGRDLAVEAGVALTIENLRLEEIIQRARVPRSSVYRMWAYREQYLEDLLYYLAGEGSWFSDRPVLDPETFAVVRQIIAEHASLMATPEGRLALLREVTRISADRNYAALTESAQWRLHMALVATLGSTWTGETRARIAAALEAAQRVSRESIVAVLGYLMQMLGMRLRDPAFTLDHVQMAGGLLVQSLALRNVQVQATIRDGKAGNPDSVHANGLLNDPVPGPGLNGEQVPWSLVARSYLALLESFIEPDPDFKPPA